MSVCNLIEYNDSYSDTSGSLWHFKRDKKNMNNGNISVGVNSANTISFKIQIKFL